MSVADLRGARVALLEGRMGGELAGLVTRHGGAPIVAPALLEVAVDASGPVEALLDRLAAGEIEVVVFLTGVAATALLAAADGLGRGEELVSRLQRTVNVARGQKPWRPLKQRGIPVSLTVEAPYTVREVVQGVESVGVSGRGVALLHYGERSDELSSALRDLGARLLDLSLYEWRPPEDTRPLESLIGEVIGGRVDVVAFTSQVQLRHLLLVSERMGVRDALVDALRTRTLVAAVGPTCAAALEAAGIVPDVVPDHPKMGPMVVAIAESLAARRAAG
jgi:uroporphyrinogen-III synthase